MPAAAPMSWIALPALAGCLALFAGCGLTTGASAGASSSAPGPSTPRTAVAGLPAASTAPAGLYIPGAPITIAPLAGAPPEALAVIGNAGPDRVLERAPIESLELRVGASSPAQHFIDVTSGLPNGCAQFYGYELRRAGDIITLAVWNTMPADTRAACTMQYGVTVHAVPIGSDFVSGRQYTLRINDRDATFIAR